MERIAKIALIIFDGLGDRPVSELDNKTPLEKAHTPNLDLLAKNGITGLLDVLGSGRVPGSDVAHLTLFGYDINQVYGGRGPIEVAGLGVKLQEGDIALRGNIGTVDENGTIIDRRAGRITDVGEFAQALNGIEIDGITFIVTKGTAHRVGVIMRGPNLSPAIGDADPHITDVKIQPVPVLDNSDAAKFTASVLDRFIAQAYEILVNHPVNVERIKNDQLPGNYLLLRGAGKQKNILPFQKKFAIERACAIAGAGLYKGVATYVGMDVIDVPGTTGLPNTDVRAKFLKLRECLNTYDFVFTHVKAADSLAEDGNCRGKVAFIEKIDQAADVLHTLPEDTLIIVTGDHSTPCELKFHSADPVPLLIHGPGVRIDQVTEFGERACARGGLGVVKGIDLMPEAMNLIGLGDFVGA